MPSSVSFPRSLSCWQFVVLQQLQQNMQTNLQQFSRENMFHDAVGSFAVALPSHPTMPQWRLAPISVDYCTLLRLAWLAFNWNMILRLTMIESVHAEQMSGASKIRFSISAMCTVQSADCQCATCPGASASSHNMLKALGRATWLAPLYSYGMPGT